ncbi:hypothetical protein U8L64_01045, partial [Pseudomonas sp. FIP_A4]
MLSNAAEGILVVGEDGYVTFANPAIAELQGETFAGDQRVVGKAWVLLRIGNFEDAAAGDGVGAEGDFPRGFAQQLQHAQHPVEQLELVSLVYRDTPLSLVGDPQRLKQVLTNLVSN